MIRTIQSDLVLIHDLELVPLSILLRGRGYVWDVHEDYAESVSDRAWIPSWARSSLKVAIRHFVGTTNGRIFHLCAEESYVSFLPEAQVVPNTTVVPSTYGLADHTKPRVVYLGRISSSRGLREMIDLAKLGQKDYKVEIIGSVDSADYDLLKDAATQNILEWTEYLPNDLALQKISGAIAGLSLLHPHQNFLGATPTKIFEYMSRGIPVISTPLPNVQELFSEAGGYIVPFFDSLTAHAHIKMLISEPEQRAKSGRLAHTYVYSRRNWNVDKIRFLETLDAYYLKYRKSQN